MELRDEISHQPIQADANTIPKGSLDCGIQAIGCCNGPGCQKLATIRAFLVIFALVGVLQGTVENYFRITVQQVSADYGFNATLVDWLLAVNSIAQSVIIIGVTYWAGRFHFMSWLGCLTMLQAISSLLVIIPTLSSQTTELTIHPNTPSPQLCRQQSLRLHNGDPYAIDTLVFMFILQVGTALGAGSFYTIGFTYLDDNAELVDSPALIATALAAKLWGTQMGSVVSIAVHAMHFTWWLGWAIIAPALFILGFLITFFPRRLLRTVIKMAASQIVERNNFSNSRPRKFIEDVNLMPSLKRLFQNRILILNILGMMFVQAATVNYLRYEQSYIRSRFSVPSNESSSLVNEWTSRFLAHLLKPLTMALTVLLAGLIISKINPSARTLTVWNIFIGSIAGLLYISFIFIKCPDVKIAATMGKDIMLPYCASNCVCPQNLQFLPVCPQGSTQTYFSPCHAGCSSQTMLNDVKIYNNCTCGADSDVPITNSMATEGACSYNSCQKTWIVFQVMTIFSAALLSSGIIGRIIISLRCVLTQDKSLALALDLTITGLFSFIPAKIGYDFVAAYTCQYKSPASSECQLYQSPLHGNILNIISATLIFLAIIMDIVLFIHIKYLDIYHDNTEESFRTLPMRAISSNSRYAEMTDMHTDDNDASYYSNNSPLITSIQSTQTNYPSHQSAEDERLDFTISNEEQAAVNKSQSPSNMPDTASSTKNKASSNHETDF